MDQKDELTAHEEIRNLVGRYCDAIARMDLDAVAASWAPDGVWTVFGEDVEGRSAILATFRELTSRVTWVVQHASSSWIEVSDASGEGVWQIVEYGQQRGEDGPGAGLIHVGRYVDRYAQIDGEWRFAARSFHTLYFGSLALGR